MGHISIIHGVCILLEYMINDTFLVNPWKYLIKRRGCCFKSNNKDTYTRYLISQIFQIFPLLHSRGAPWIRSLQDPRGFELFYQFWTFLTIVN